MSKLVVFVGESGGFETLPLGKVASTTGELGIEEIGELGKETQEPGMMVTWKIGLG